MHVEILEVTTDEREDGLRVAGVVAGVVTVAKAWASRYNGEKAQNLDAANAYLKQVLIAASAPRDLHLHTIGRQQVTVSGAPFKPQLTADVALERDLYDVWLAQKQMQKSSAAWNEFRKELRGEDICLSVLADRADGLRGTLLLKQNDNEIFVSRNAVDSLIEKLHELKRI